ncbi:flagella synthesis protein FlgN [Shewanella violacea]|uniref:Flagellar biosynthetic protein FlgN n=1 Tax=Shewanella violacea (strain JCM 10179 / CIP 106290 / LMG 19151 / DSS12) TaxID=637905 RepID=D4ZI77_SHEVD|nr:flagellar export chaperone FlgN [Shewanella violacea]BAJ01376.1 flagellar biosynthetic protein FlgN [Shewanella violacea DSS12]
MSQINDIVELQFELLNKLKVIIKDETTALTNQDADSLLSLASAKAGLLDELKRKDEALSLHADKALLISDVHLSARVTSAKNLLDECKQLNSENSSLIELNIASMNRFSQALQVSRNASSLTYNGKGKTSTISTLGNDIQA